MRTLLLLMLLFASPANALVIDAFDSGDAFAIENLLGGGAALSQPADVLGGTREVFTTDRVEFDPSIGLDFLESISINGYVEITYRLGGLNITPNGTDDGSGAYQVTWELVNDRFTSATAGFQILADGADSNTQPVLEGVVLLPFRGDPTDVDVLTLKFQPYNTVGGDRYRITDFRIVPQPSTASLLVIGLTGLAVRRRWMQ